MFRLSALMLFWRLLFLTDWLFLPGVGYPGLGLLDVDLPGVLYTFLPGVDLPGVLLSYVKLDLLFS